MNPSHYYLSLLLMLIPLWTVAQNIFVKSFKLLPHDQTARVHHPVKDQNGEKCALIKIVTTHKGFVWEGGTLGITDVENKTGEYWVYVPRGSKKITIKHDHLGILRDYQYPQVIKKAMVYEMALTTDKVKTIVEETELPAHWLVIESEPKEANVFINGKLAGRTPFQRKYKQGEYNYRVSKALYHPQTGKLSIEDEKKLLDIRLKPRFGHLRVTSEPEDSMVVYLDHQRTGKKTPASFKRIASGKHTLQLQSQWYQPVTRQLRVQDEDTSQVHFQLQPAFANISITSRPPAEIFLDEQHKATGSWDGRLLEGVYSVKVQKDTYVSQSRQIEVLSQQDKQIHFDLKAKTADVDVITVPIGAEVYHEGKKQGTTPFTLQDLSMGDHQIKLRKKGYAETTKHFRIDGNNTVTIEEKLEKSQEPRASAIKDSSSKGNGKVYTVADQMPTFNGKDLYAFKRYVQRNIDYPVKAAENQIEGTVHARFVVNRDGSISNIEIQKGDHPLLEEQVTKFLEKLPDWQPGKHDGETVRVSFTLPFAFKLIPAGF